MVRDCLRWTKIVKGGQRLLETVEVVRSCKRLPKMWPEMVRGCQRVSKIVRHCQRLSEIGKGCRRLLKIVRGGQRFIISYKSADFEVKGAQNEIFNLSIVFRKGIYFIYYKFHQCDRVPLR